MTGRERMPQYADTPLSAMIVPMIVENQVVGAIQVFNQRLMPTQKMT